MVVLVVQIEWLDQVLVEQIRFLVYIRCHLFHLFGEVVNGCAQCINDRGAVRLVYHF